MFHSKLLVAVLVSLVAYLVYKQISNSGHSNSVVQPESKQTSDAITYAPIVKLSAGPVRGRVVNYDSDDGHTQLLHLYEGIRYGQADRFQKARPVSSWSPAILDAITPRHSCPQKQYPEMSELFQNPVQHEDCLFLNVMRPAISDEEANRSPLKVMFFIHGGAYAMGTIFSPFVDPRHIVAGGGDVIVVTVNYRLGPLGFLYADDRLAPGNLGLHDILLALQWTHANIGHFGGNTRDLTVFGVSAGSMATGALILSPLAAGLFTRAIMQGGAPNSMFTESKQAGLARTKDLARKLSCATDSLDQMIACLRTKSTQALLDPVAVTFDRNDFFVPIFGDDFLPISPVEALEVGAFNRGIDLMFGVTRDEGSMFVAQIFPKLVQETPANLTVQSTADDIRYMIDDLFRLGIGAQVAQYYIDRLPANPTEDELKITLSDVWGDLCLICPTVLFGEALHRHAPHQHYYAYRTMQVANFGVGDVGDAPDTHHHLRWMGVQHGADASFIFMKQLYSTPENRRLAGDLIEAFTGFARTGVPAKLGSFTWEAAFEDEKATSVKSTRHVSLHSNHYRMVEDTWTVVCGGFWRPLIRNS